MMSEQRHFPDSRLAIDGGDPIVPRGLMMHSRWPRIAPDEVEGLIGVLRAGLLTEMSGRDLVHQFESEVAMWLGVRFAMTTNSGTAALHCALAGLGVAAGDEVIVPALSYIACAAAVVHQHAIPVFADVDPYTFNITAETVEPCLSERTRAIMVVHLHGLPAEMDSLRALGRRRGIAILEDFSQAAGAKYKDRYVGSLGDAGAASFMAGKNLPSGGEGGVVVSNDREVRNRAASLKCFGEFVDVDGRHHLTHATLGYNYRINILSMQMVSQQIFHVDRFNDVRIASARRLDACLREIPGFSPPAVRDGSRHVYHMYRFRFDPATAGLSVSADQAREALKRIFAAEGLPLVEFQNMPLPGHALLQRTVGDGSGCPWSCHGRDDIAYRIEHYPNSLDVIRHSLVIGMPAQATLANPSVIDAYLRAFEKVSRNLHALERCAAALPSTPAWSQPARLF